MANKSKQKAVTLAKSASDFAITEVHDAVGEGAATVAPNAEPKSALKASKLAKSQSHDEHPAPVDDTIAAYRILAERSLEQARDAFSKARAEAEILSGKLEESSSALTGGTTAMQSYVVKAMQTQADDLFGYFRALTEVKTVSDAIALQSTQSRRTFDSSLRQFKDISALMNDMAVKAAAPVRSVFPLLKD